MKEMLWACRGAFATAAVFSFFVNLMIMIMPIYMFSLFDRVLGGGGNKVTLTFLALFAMSGLLIQALIDIGRTYLFVRVSAWIDTQIGEKVLAVSLRYATARGAERNTALLGRLDALRNFLAGEQIYMLMDLPWVPLFLTFLFFLQFWIGVTATVIAVILFIMALANKWFTDPLRDAGMAAMQSSMSKATTTMRNADVIDAMGMGRQLTARWNRDNAVSLDKLGVYTRRSGMISAIGKSMQLASMMAVMTVSVILILDPESGLSRGAMMAAVILVGRILMPVQSMVTGWSAISMSVGNYREISKILREAATMRPSDMVDNTVPRGELTVENLGFHPVTAEKPILTDISLALQPGQSLGIVGASASGKTSLARLLIGVDRPTTGRVLLDGRELHEWPSDDIGPHLGYLPQEVELFAGTVRDNITRFDDEWTREAVLDAAKLADVDGLIKFMPNGYQTVVGNRGTILSGGQMQRVGLARALYGDVKLVVLDEPNSNLDVHGEQALASAIEELKKRGVIVVVILHRPNILNVLDYIMVMADGKVQKMGRRDEMLPVIGGSGSSKQPDDRAINVVSNQAKA